MSELKPCPFCGGEANTLHRPHVIDWRYSVGCNDDECRGFIGLSWLYKTEAEAIAAWNSRAERICHDEGDPRDFCCSECGTRMFTDVNDTYTMIANDEQTIIKHPNYCPNCGCKVVG